MAWISDLAGIKRHGTVLNVSCRDKACSHWSGLEVAQLIEEYGAGTDIRDFGLRCDGCGGEVLILAAPGAGTPARPVR